MNNRWTWLLSLCCVFSAGLLCGFFLSTRTARAAQEFGPEDVKSVPENFVLGNNKLFAIQRDLLTATLENQKHLQAIEENTRSMAGLLQRGNSAPVSSSKALPVPPPPRPASPATRSNVPGER